MGFLLDYWTQGRNKGWFPRRMLHAPTLSQSEGARDDGTGICPVPSAAGSLRRREGNRGSSGLLPKAWGARGPIVLIWDNTKGTFRGGVWPDGLIFKVRLDAPT